jgi:hypothetical protein
MNNNEELEFDYEAYFEQKKTFYQNLYTPKTLQEDFDKLAIFVMEFLAYFRTNWGLYQNEI